MVDTPIKTVWHIKPSMVPYGENCPLFLDKNYNKNFWIITLHYPWHIFNTQFLNFCVRIIFINKLLPTWQTRFRCDCNKWKQNISENKQIKKIKTKRETCIDSSNYCSIFFIKFKENAFSLGEKKKIYS